MKLQLANRSILPQNLGLSLKDRIKRSNASQAFLEQLMFLYYQIRNGNKVAAELEYRKSVGLFAIDKLAATLAYGPEERVIDNNLYGYASYLKKYAGIKHDLKAYMEHGLFLGGIVHPDQYHWHFPRIITMSKRRQEILKAKIPHKESIAIGPYIHYAPSLLAESEMASLKSKLGKTLLVYPFHSMKNVKAGFNDHDLIKEIKRVAKDFNSVLISLYYLDALDQNKLSAYESEGFRIVTAGHRYDRHFIARQRSHIELSDHTMSNGMGTQTGFCVYMQKPHYIFQQQIEQKASNQREQKRFAAGGSAGTVKEKVAQERAFFSHLFADLRPDISAQQLEATADFWGFADVKSKSELNNLF